jgi:putative acetyltransferase
VRAVQGRAEVRVAVTAADWASVGELVREYVASLPFPLDFQDVDRELAELETEYGPPGGVALLACMAGSSRDVGTVGVRRFDGASAELKRMYVRPEARGTGAGRALAEAAIDHARRLGYRRILLDTVASMRAATALYESLGFRRVPPYRHNPRLDAAFYALDLRGE